MVKSFTLGVLSPVTGGFFYGEITAGVARELGAVGGRIVLIQTLDAGLSSDEVEAAPDFRTPTAWEYLDGIISIAHATQRQYLDEVVAAGKALALASEEIPGLEAPAAVPDNSTGVSEAVRHLVGHGHTRIGFAGNLVQSDMTERHDAYQAGMREHGLDPDPKWFFTAADNGEVGGRDVAAQIVAARLPITALILATDRNAIGCMAHLRDVGVGVPDDLAIVGYDGIDAGAYTEPTLSTVRQPFGETGALAARLVISQLRGDEVETRTHRAPSTFWPRGSCGCPDTAGRVDTDLDADFWRDQARLYYERSASGEQSKREQYLIGMRLLDHERTDPTDLQWLETTESRGACLALWVGDPSNGRLRIAGVHDPNRALPALVGTTCSLEQFPPSALIALADPAVNEVTVVVPVKSRGLDYGLLAVAGEIDTMSNSGRETENHWAALLTAAIEQRRLIENVRTSEERYGLWATATNDGLWDWDLATDTIYYSGRCMELFGHPYQAVRADPSVWFEALHPDDLHRVRELLSGAGTGPLQPVEFEHRVRGIDGDFLRLSCQALPVGPPDGPAERIVGSIHDIEPRKQLEERLRQGALYDEVTGLPNRKLFLERLTFAITDARKSSGLRYAVVFLDVDGFKLVNDSLGHLAGDQLLSEIGRRLRAGLRSSDLAARFGGDEFAVLLSAIEPSSIWPIVERMMMNLAAPIDLDGHEVTVSASIGITTSDGNYTDADDVLRDADIAMYHAKVHNRGSFSMFDAEMQSGSIARLEMQSELREALDRGQFEVHYQPIIDLDDSGIDRFEALVRWRHPRNGLVGPMDFLTTLEEIGLMVTLGLWVIEEVCRQIAEWQRLYDGTVNVSVNVSRAELTDDRLLPHILGCLRRHGLAPSNLTLEVTEKTVMSDTIRASTLIEQLQTAGIQVQIDDIGAGTSSLHALRSLSVHALKIDRSFIRELTVDSPTQNIVRLIIGMGDRLGFDVIAEGVETAAQLEMLREMGCHRAQGFWFTEAVGASDAARMLGRPFAFGNEDSTRGV